eukprot:351413-Chlamydomonas_euryale.AAC.2
MTDGFEPRGAYGSIEGFDDPSMGWARFAQFYKRFNMNSGADLCLHGLSGRARGHARAAHAAQLDWTGVQFYEREVQHELGCADDRHVCRVAAEVAAEVVENLGGKSQNKCNILA